MVDRRVALFLAALIVPVRTAAQVPSAPRAVLAPPMGLGGECGLLLSCPWSGRLAVHFRLGGLVWLGQDGDPRPVSILPSAALSVSLWRWAEAGAVFSARAGSATDGGPAFLQLPIKLWARLSPLAHADGLAVAAQVGYDVGHGPFAGAGTMPSDTETYSFLVGYRKARFDANLAASYIEAGERTSRGFEGGAALWFMVWRKLGLELGGEAVARLVSPGAGAGLAPSWIAVAGLRFIDEHGISGTLGYTAGGGPSMPRQGPLFVFGMSFGPTYTPHPPALGYEPLLPAIEGWIGERLRQLAAPRPGIPPPVPPPRLSAAMGGDPHGSTSRPPLLEWPSSCSLPARCMPPQVLRGCVVAPYRYEFALNHDQVIADVLAAGPRLMGPERSRRLGIAQAPPRPPRGPVRMLPGWSPRRGAAATADGPPPPTFWTSGRPGGPTVGATGTPPPPPSIPVEVIRPEPPVWMRGVELPPALRPPPARALAPMRHSALPPPAEAAPPRQEPLESPRAPPAQQSVADHLPPYQRPAHATTPTQRRSVNDPADQPCVTCGQRAPKMVADHKKPLVEEYYETGTVDRARMRSVDAVQPQCPACSARQGARLRHWSAGKKGAP